MRTIGREDAITDPRFRTVADRTRNVTDWLAIRAEALRTRTAGEWLSLFAAADVPAMPCHSLESLLLDPHLRGVGLLEAASHPSEGGIQALRPTVLFDGATGPKGQPAPPVGWDTHEVLEELGLEIEAIRQPHVSGCAVDGRANRGVGERQRGGAD